MLFVACWISGCSSKSFRSPVPTSSDLEATAVECHVVNHDLGQACVSKQPQRIVVLGRIALDSVLSLGMKPIAAGTDSFEQPFPNYLERMTQGIESIGMNDSPSLEKVVKLQPDLIIGVNYAVKAIYDQLLQIAPTIAIGERQVKWKDYYLQIADALGRIDRAKQQLETYNQRLKEFRTAMGDRLANTEVSILTIGADNTPSLYVNSSFIGSVLQDAGLPRPPSQDIFLNNHTSFTISLERLSEADGNIIFLINPLEKSNTDGLNKLRSHPLWSQLDAVKQGRVYEVDESTWLDGGILTANAILDDLFKYLVQP